MKVCLLHNGKNSSKDNTHNIPDARRFRRFQKNKKLLIIYKQTKVMPY